MYIQESGMDPAELSGGGIVLQQFCCARLNRADALLSFSSDFVWGKHSLYLTVNPCLPGVDTYYWMLQKLLKLSVPDQI